MDLAILDKKYIRLTDKRVAIIIKQILLCTLDPEIVKKCALTAHNVHISTRVMKHVYDKRPAQEYDTALYHLRSAIKYPDYIFKNKQGKRGDVCFVARVKDRLLWCPVEESKDKNNHPILEVVTFFLAQYKYANNYTLLWGRGDGTAPHRNALDKSNGAPQ